MAMFSFGKKKAENSSSSSTFVDPNQSPYLQDIYGQAQQLNAQGMPVEGVAGINGMLGGALGTAYGAGGMQAGVGANMMASGANATQGTGMALNYAGGAMGGNAQGGINTAMGAGQGMANMAGMAGAANNRGFNANNAGQYMNNSLLNSQIDAASTDVVRNLQENQLTGIASNAAGSGNSGSSRAGVAAGIATRGAGDRIGDISANMRGQAYNTGLNIEANRASQNAGFQQQANQSNQSAVEQSTNTDTVEVATISPEQQAEEQLRQKYEALRQEQIIYFDFDKATVENKYAELLRAHAEFLVQNPSVKVLIEGHADERGTPEYNIALGEHRGQAVEKYLQSLGVSASQMSVVSYGEEKPMVKDRSEGAFAKNRRAVLVY